MRFDNELIFHPVGQGSFITGQLFKRSKKRELDLTYIFDCGSESDKEGLKNSIDRFAANTTTDVIDLLIVSHFDADHRNGLAQLLQNFRVRLILLPYAPLDVRLATAMARGAGPDELEFARNPTRYISERSERGVERIAYIGSPPQPDSDDGAEAGLDPDRPQLIIDLGPEADVFTKASLDKARRTVPGRFDGAGSDGDPEKEDLENSANAPVAMAVAFFPGDCVLVQSVWEFVPYNDAKWQPKSPPRFETEVRLLRRALLASHGPSTDAALTRLRVLYDEEFGNSSEARNRVSLSVYAGPVRDGKLNRKRINFHNQVVVSEHQKFSCSTGNALGQLFTGDADYRIQSYNRFSRQRLIKPRIDRIGVFQAAHHGSKYNWHKGLAQKLLPHVTVFCADPGYTYRHPDLEVLHDFLGFTTLIANTHEVRIDTSVSFKAELTL
jgi:hypothetical protein